MRRTMLHAKIHHATVTDANVDYEGSITIDQSLMEAARILEYEQVQVADVNNGVRFETYAIAGDPGSGEVVVNGAAARLVSKGDRVIVMAYAEVEDSEAAFLRPTIVKIGDSNLEQSLLELR